MVREYLPEEYTKEDRDLIKVFQQTMNELELAYLKAIHSNDTIKANAFLKQIKGVAKTLNDEYSDRADIRITEEYLKGVKYLDEAWEIEDTIGFVDFSKWKAKEMIGELWPAHVQAVNALLNTSKNYVKSSLDGLERQTMSLIGELQQQRVREELAKWILKGESRFEVNKKVTKYFEEQNLWFKDRAWRVWTMDRYVDMLTRTETAIANVQGTINRWIQVWLTKFRVIEHFDCCSTCANYNWEVFDVSKGIVSLPPYHPNCRGYIEAVIDGHDYKDWVANYQNYKLSNEAKENRFIQSAEKNIDRIYKTEQGKSLIDKIWRDNAIVANSYTWSLWKEINKHLRGEIRNKDYNEMSISLSNTIKNNTQTFDNIYRWTNLPKTVFTWIKNSKIYKDKGFMSFTQGEKERAKWWIEWDWIWVIFELEQWKWLNVSDISEFWFEKEVIIDKETLFKVKEIKQGKDWIYRIKINHI